MICYGISLIDASVQKYLLPNNKQSSPSCFLLLSLTPVACFTVLPMGIFDMGWEGTLPLGGNILLPKLSKRK